MSNESVLNAFPGASASASDSASITIPSFDGVDSKTYYLPPGEYRAKVSGFKQDVSQSGNKMLVFSFDVSGPSGTLKDRRFFCPITANALWKLKRTCDALGIPEGSISVKSVIGRECMVNIADDGESDNGDKRCKVTSCNPIAAKSPSPSAGFGTRLPPGPEDDDIPF